MDRDNVVDAGTFVRVHERGPVRLVVLDRPERHNALIPDLVDGLRSAVRAAEADPAVRAVVLAAEGPNFSTGGDVSEFARRSGPDLAAYAREIVGGLHALILELLRLDVPVVTAVRGMVTGGSLGVVLASDLVLATPDATFAPYYVDVGFSPDGGWTALLPDRIGRSRAMSVQLRNHGIDARTALAWGLVSEVVGTGDVTGDVTAAAMAVAEEVAGKRAGSVGRTKQLMRGDLVAIGDRLRAELDAFVEQVVTPEAAAGMAEFLARRRPVPSASAPTARARGVTPCAYPT